MPREKNPNKRNVTLMVDGELYDKYRELCQREGWLVSRQFEKLMEEHVEQDKVAKDGRNSKTA